MARLARVSIGDSLVVVRRGDRETRLRGARLAMAHIAVQGEHGGRPGSWVSTGGSFPRVGLVTGTAIRISNSHMHEAGLR